MNWVTFENFFFINLKGFTLTMLILKILEFRLFNYKFLYHD